MKDGDMLLGHPIKLGEITSDGTGYRFRNFQEWPSPVATIQVQAPANMTETEVIALVESETGMKATVCKEG